MNTTPETARLEAARAELAEIETQIENWKDDVSLDDSGAADAYNEMLDDCFSFASVGGPFEHMSPARVLAEVDPTAYRCGFNDWLDSLDSGEGFKAHDDLVERRGELEDEIEELEAELDIEDSEI